MSLSKRVRFEVFKRDKFTCGYCGRRPPDVMLEADHVVPRAEGGGDELANLVTSCFDCNRGKAAVPLGDVAPAVDEMQVLEAVQDMLERQYQMRGQIQAERALEDAAREAHDYLERRWHQEHPWKPRFDFARLRPFYRTLDVTEMSEAMDIALSWKARNRDKDEKDAFQYFTGIMRNMAKAKEEQG